MAPLGCSALAMLHGTYKPVPYFPYPYAVPSAPSVVRACSLSIPRSLEKYTPKTGHARPQVL